MCRNSNGNGLCVIVANLFLFYYEYRYTRGLIITNLVLAKKFNNTEI